LASKYLIDIMTSAYLGRLEYGDAVKGNAGNAQNPGNAKNPGSAVKQLMEFADSATATANGNG
jgi:hypothetical protein